MEQLWQRVSEGRHTALLDIVPGEPPSHLGLRVLRVRCDVPEATLGPLHDVQTRVEQLVGGAPPLLDQARSRVVSGLRRRLLGDVHERIADADFIETVNRLARQKERRWVIVFDAVESADPATLDVLRRVLSRHEALRVALVLSFRLHAPTGPAGELLSAMRAAFGQDAVLRPPDGTTTLTSAVAPPPPVSAAGVPAEEPYTPPKRRRKKGEKDLALSLERLEEDGMTVAMVETGGDPGHAAARRTYQKAGFVLLPIARYFKNL